VRTALGAQRGRIIGQLLTESVVLSLLSLPIGVILAEVGTRLISSAVPTDQVPYYIRWVVDWRALAFTVGASVTTAVLFGLFPALQASRGDLHGDLKEGTRGNSVRRSLLRSSLVVVQVALALVSLIGALLFVRTFANLDSYNVGFDTKPIMTMRFYLPGAAYEVEDAKARRVQDIVERVERLPGVQAAFASNLVPVSGGGGGGNVIVDGKPSEPGREPGISFTGVTPGFYRTLGLTMTRGRDFTAAEGWSRTRVAVISETMAKRLWTDRDPIGSRFRMTGGDESEEWFTIIGVAPDIKQDGIDPDDVPVSAAYVPYIFQQTLNTGLVLRVSGDPAAITSAVRSELRASDPNLPMFQVRTMDDVRRLGFWQFALFGWVFGTTGVIGLLLASIGVYGVLAYAVAQRTPEIGVRMALGAGRGHVLRLILWHGMLLAGIGAVVGLALSAVAMPAASTLLYGVSPFDPLTFIAVPAFLLAVAFIASYLPARRAMGVDPLVALRGD
jgi:putative ABC transport system permease protein